MLAKIAIGAASIVLATFALYAIGFLVLILGGMRPGLAARRAWPAFAGAANE